MVMVRKAAKPSYSIDRDLVTKMASQGVGGISRPGDHPPVFQYFAHLGDESGLRVDGVYFQIIRDGSPPGAVLEFPHNGDLPWGVLNRFFLCWKRPIIA
jgi:hypothetical protein